MNCKNKRIQKLYQAKYVHVTKTFVLLLVSVVSLTSCTFLFGYEKVSKGNRNGEVGNCFSTLWPHEKSDLKPDPEIKFGRLDNGLRYLIKPNDTPKGRVALHLNVQAGSVHESDDEQGYAHYLEHMLFNGTENFPPGKLIEYFQDIGMAFGADANAHTSYDETVYKIVLPSGDVDNLAKGVLVLSDFARSPLLLESEVERERGVILAEKLARDSNEYQMRLASRKNAFKGSILAERQTIGIEKSLMEANSSSLRRFYNSWYRPEKMVIMAIGDADPKEIEKLIKKNFEKFSGSMEMPDCPELGEIESKGVRSFYYHEPDAGKTRLAIESYWNKAEVDDSLELQKKLIKDYIAANILEKRLEKLAEQEEGPFTHPQVFAGSQLDRFGYASVSVTATKDKWRQGLVAMENSLRQILTFGITQAELVRAKKEAIAYYKSRLLSAETQKTSSLARQILWNLNNNRVYQSPEQEMQLYLPVIQSFSVRDINSALIKMWEHEDRLIEVKGNAVIPDDNPKELVKNIYQAALNIEVTPYESAEAKKFPYLLPSIQPIGPIQHTYVENIGADVYQYQNGITLNLKNTDFEKNRINIVLEFGPGKISEKHRGASLLAEKVINSSGTDKLTQSEIDDSLAGSTISYDFSIGESSFSFSGESVSDESEKLMQVLYNIFVDPGIREDVFDKKKVEARQGYEAMQSTIRGAESIFIDRFLSGNNPIYSRPLWQEVEKVKVQDIRQWLQPYFLEAAPEITIVGDFDKKSILSLTNKYFGTLGKRKTFKQEKQSADYPKGETFEKGIPTKQNKALLVMAWQTEGFTNIERMRRLNMLAAVFEERVRLAIREKLGASYSPDAYHSSSRLIQDFGFIKARMVIAPGKINEVRQTVTAICKKLILNGVSEEEMHRVKEPLLTALNDQIETNGYWLRVLRQSSTFKDQLLWPSTIVRDHASVSAEELSQLAKKYLRPELTTTAVIRPEN